MGHTRTVLDTFVSVRFHHTKMVVRNLNLQNRAMRGSRGGGGGGGGGAGIRKFYLKKVISGFLGGWTPSHENFWIRACEHRWYKATSNRRSFKIKKLLGYTQGPQPIRSQIVLTEN